MAIQIYSCQLDWIYDEDMFVLMISYYLECFNHHQEATNISRYLPVGLIIYSHYRSIINTPLLKKWKVSIFGLQNGFRIFLGKVLDLVNFFDNGGAASHQALSQFSTYILFLQKKVCHHVILFSNTQNCFTQSWEYSYFLHNIFDDKS